MSEQTTTANGQLTIEQEMRIDLEKIDGYFDQLDFGTGATILLEQGEIAEPMLATTSEGSEVRIFRWRHNRLDETGHDKRIDTYCMLGESALVLMNADLEQESKWVEKGEFERIAPARQQVVNEFAASPQDVASHEGDLRDVRQVLVAAFRATRKTKAA
jgi:hypothetical protein